MTKNYENNIYTLKRTKKQQMYTQFTLYHIVVLKLLPQFILYPFTESGVATDLLNNYNLSKTLTENMLQNHRFWKHLVLRQLLSETTSFETTSLRDT